jgi:hypothetical protein
MWAPFIFVHHYEYQPYIKEKASQSKRITTLLLYGDRDRIQTCNPHIRSVVLYSVELRSHLSLASAKIRLFFNLAMRILKKIEK